MLSDMTTWNPDVQVGTMDEAIRILRAQGSTCRLYACPHAWDSIAIAVDGVEFHFTPWFIEVDGCNFAIGEWVDADDDYRQGSHIKVAFDNGQGLANVIAEWMTHRTF
jgi:hypothetical protein